MSEKADFLESEAIRIEKKLLDWTQEQLKVEN